MCRVGSAIWRSSRRSATADGARRGNEAPQQNIFQRWTKWRENRERARRRTRCRSSAWRIYSVGKIYFPEQPCSKRSITHALPSRFRAEESSPQSFPLVGVSVTCVPAPVAVTFLNQSYTHHRKTFR